MSNTEPHQTRGWTQVLGKGKQFLYIRRHNFLHYCFQSSEEEIQPDKNGWIIYFVNLLHIFLIKGNGRELSRFVRVSWKWGEAVDIAGDRHQSQNVT